MLSGESPTSLRGCVKRARRQKIGINVSSAKLTIGPSDACSACLKKRGAMGGGGEAGGDAAHAGASYDPYKDTCLIHYNDITYWHRVDNPSAFRRAGQGVRGWHHCCV